MNKLHMVRDHLAQAECHVTSGQDHIRRQARVVRYLERKQLAGLTEARRLLDGLNELQREHIATRDRLRTKAEELSRYNSSSSEREKAPPERG